MKKIFRSKNIHNFLVLGLGQVKRTLEQGVGIMIEILAHC